MKNIQNIMNMWFFRGRKRGRGGVVVGLLLFFFMAPLAFTACDNGDPEIDITVKSDYGKIIEAINNANQSLTEKMSLIEAAMARGFADGREAQVLMQKAVSSLSGTLSEKLAAVETAVKGQTASLETKLGLIDAAVTGGFADSKTQQALIGQAVASLSGTLAEKLAAVETAVKGQTASLETKLALIETALKKGLADDKEAQELLRQAIGSLTGTLAERLQAVEKAMENQASSLAAKLDLIETALADRLARNNEALALIGKAVASLGGTLEEKLAAVDTALQGRTTGLETKLGLIEAAVRSGFADGKAQQELLQKALQSLDGTAGTKLAAVEAAIGSQRTTLASKLDLIEEAVREGLADSQKKQELIADALASLDGTLKEKLAAIDTAMTHQTDSLTTKLDLIRQAWATGLASDTTAIGLIKTAVASLQGSADEVAEALKAIDDALQADGGIGQTLDNIAEAVRNKDYGKYLLAITRTLWVMSGKINGHEFVDLGNGLKWATCNVGAEHPWDKGDYFAWGETEPYYEGLNPLYWKENKNEGYYWSSYSDNPSGDSTHFIKYGYYDYGLKTLLEPEDDAATVNWGGTWRMPTYEEWKWMETHCTFTWTDNYERTGVPGVIVKSTVAGYTDHTIFFPTAGCIERIDIKIDNKALVWSSSWCDDSNGENLVRTSRMATMVAMSQFNEGTDIGAMNPGPAYRYRGASVRPVSF